MDGGQNKMPGLGRAEGQPHRFRLAHFAHHQHVRVFAQAVQQRLLEAGRVAPHFPLPDKGPARRNVNSMGFSMVTMCRASLRLIVWMSAANVVDFPAARRAADEHQTVRMMGQLLEVGMQVQGLHRRLVGGQQADGKPDAARGVQHVDPATKASITLERSKERRS